MLKHCLKMPGLMLSQQ